MISKTGLIGWADFYTRVIKVRGWWHLNATQVKAAHCDIGTIVTLYVSTAFVNVYINFVNIVNVWHFFVVDFTVIHFVLT